ncbi:putative homing endonuclease [Vibrio phage 466E53-1]|nr:putative homing endonuclease [Vibrio phage 466E53-1]
MTARKMPGKDYFLKYLHYNEGTGDFTWKKRDLCDFKTLNAFGTFNTRFGGKSAGGKNTGKTGKTYREIRLHDKSYLAHRIAWVICNGSIEDGHDIDHINGDGTDNRICNLRSVTRSDNGKNQRLRIDNTSGATGVYNLPNGTYLVQISHSGKRHNVGTFSNFNKAVAARKEAERRNGYHENHGEKIPL